MDAKFWHSDAAALATAPATTTVCFDKNVILYLTWVQISAVAVLSQHKVLKRIIELYDRPQ